MYSIGYAIGQEEIILDQTADKSKIERKVNKIFKKIAEENLEFSYVFVRNGNSLIELSTLLPKRFEKIKK